MSRKNSRENKAIRRAEREDSRNGAVERQAAAKRSFEYTVGEGENAKTKLYTLPSRKDRRRKDNV